MALRGGRYELLGTIAAGGMATVHLGRALGAGGFERLVAIKTMHPHLGKEAEFVAMFLDEARLAARIRHPNVVGTLDIQHDADGLFLVMEYVEGPSLARMLRALAKEGKRLPLDVGLRIFMDLLAGLHAAHELTGPGGEPLRLIHRDMSPHNVLVGADGVVRLTDFGIARAESRLASTRTGSIKGKTMYMSPEQVRSDPLDRRTDLYAAGAVLWEIFSGERLVRAETDLAMMHQIIEAERQTPHELNPEVPIELSEVCMKALERKPDMRYPTALAFAEALERAASHSGVMPATPRAVAAYVRELGIHAMPQDLPPAPPSSSLPPIATPRPSSLLSTPPPSDEARPALTQVEVPPPSASTRASFASPMRISPLPASGSPKRRTAMIIALFGTVLVIGIGLGWLVLGRGPAKSADEPAAAVAPLTSAAMTAAPPASPASAAPASAASSAPAASTAAKAAASPTASVTATAIATAPATASPSGRATAQQGTPPQGKTFRPKEL